MSNFTLISVQLMLYLQIGLLQESCEPAPFDTTLDNDSDDDANMNSEEQSDDNEEEESGSDEEETSEPDDEDDMMSDIKPVATAPAFQLVNCLC